MRAEVAERLTGTFSSELQAEQDPDNAPPAEPTPAP